MKKILSLCLIFLISAFILFSKGQEEAVKEGPISIKALTIGPSPAPITRAKILEIAGEQLREAGTNLELEVEFSTHKFPEYRRNFSLAYASGLAPDILSDDQDIIPAYVEEGMILPLDNYIKASGWESNFKDFLPGLWDAVSWKGKTYGIPFEAVVNCLFYRKDVLRKLGMSDAEIEKTFSPENKELTYEKLVELAKQAKDAGLVEWGFTHRKGAGAYHTISVMLFGGEFVDKATGNLIIDTKALRKDFEFHKMLEDDGLLPKDMSSWDWNNIHKYIVEGRTLFWLGGHSGTWKSWQEMPYHEKLGELSEEYLLENMGIAPFASIHGPVTPVKAHAYMIVSTTKNPDLSFEILAKATSPDLLSLHSITTLRGAGRKSVAEQADFKAQKYLTKVLEIMKCSKAFPKHPALTMYETMIYDAMAGIGIGKLTVDQAIEFIKAKAKSDIPGVIIK